MRRTLVFAWTVQRPVATARAKIAGDAAAAPELRDAFEVLRAEVLLLFSRTDAWRLAGYDWWPGVPRGFDDVKRAPGRP